MNYLEAFQQAEGKLQVQNYRGCIRDCGTITEVGLKALYVKQVEWEENRPDGHDILANFHRSNPEFKDLDPVKCGLFQLLKFFSLAGVWERVQVRVSSNLHFTKKIPWHELRFTRNEATHSLEDFTREQAVEFLHHIKIFLHECELAETRPSVLVDNKVECFDCGFSLQTSWSYCPSCGSEQKTSCFNCNRVLDVTWQTCPYCETPRTVDLFIEETNRLYKAYCEAVWADDIVNADERELLRRKRLELGISEDAAARIEAEVADPNIIRFMDLIRAVLVDGIIDPIEMEFLNTNAKKLGIPMARAKKLIDSMNPKRRIDPLRRLIGMR